jgi:hypothetical protein
MLSDMAPVKSSNNKNFMAASIRRFNYEIRELCEDTRARLFPIYGDQAEWRLTYQYWIDQPPHNLTMIIILTRYNNPLHTISLTIDDVDKFFKIEDVTCDIVEFIHRYENKNNKNSST